MPLDFGKNIRNQTEKKKLEEGESTIITFSGDESVQDEYQTVVSGQ